MATATAPPARLRLTQARGAARRANAASASRMTMRAARKIEIGGRSVMAAGGLLHYAWRNRMSSGSLTRRHFLTLPLVLLLAPVSRALAEGGARRTAYEADASVLFGALRFRLAGTIDERVDRAAGRYDVQIEGEGTGFSNRGEASGALRDGRWAPLASSARVKVRGREGRADIAYDYERRLVHYRARSETFFLGRVRTVDDVVPIPPGLHLDDTMSGFLNHADGHWRPEPGGLLQTHVVRRKREAGEGVEEVGGTHRAEIVPVTLTVEGDQTSGVRAASFDLTRFSSWALADHPARITFGPDGRPQQITSRLMFGTSLTLRFLST